MGQTRIEWNTLCIPWNGAKYTWDTCFIAIEIGVGAEKPEIDWVQSYEKLDERKKKKVIEVLVEIEGEEFKQKKTIDPNIKLTATQIKKFVKTVLNVEIIEEEDE